MADDFSYESHNHSANSENAQDTHSVVSNTNSRASNVSLASVSFADEGIVAHGFMRLAEFIGRVINKVEELGDSFIAFARWFMGFFDLAALFFFVPRFFNASSRHHAMHRVAETDWDAFCIYGALLLFALVGSVIAFSAKNTKELKRDIQDYQDMVSGGVEFGDNHSAFEFAVVNYKNMSKAIIDIIACSVGIVVVITLLFSFLSLLALSTGGSEYAIEILKDELSYGSPVLLLLLIAVAVSLLQKPIGYNLTFNREGISGEYYYVGDKTSLFVDTYEKPAPNDSRYRDLIKRSDEYVLWSNFMCFSYHKNCLLLWKNSQPDSNFRNRLYLKCGWFIDLEGNHSRCPLRIVGTEAEITELKNFLSGFMPYVTNVCPGEKAVI